MKKLIAVLFLSLALFAPAFCAEMKNFSGSSAFVTDGTGTLAFPPASGVRTLTYLQVTTDLTSGNITFLTLASTNDAIHSLDAAEAAGQTVISVGSTVGFTVDDYVMLWDRSTNLAEVGRITSISAGVSITLHTATSYAYENGSRVYELETCGIIDNSTNTANEGSEYWSDTNLFSVETWRPLGILTGATSASNILASGYMNVN